VSAVHRTDEIAKEASQEAQRIGQQRTPRALKLRLKRSDPNVQELLRLAGELADTVLINDITIVREKLPGAEAAILQALRNCGVPIDEFMPQIKPGFSATPAALAMGLGFLKTFVSAVDPKFADGIKRIENTLLAEAERALGARP
jgi:hypothetical protein